MIELLFVAEHFQCGANANPAQFEVIAYAYEGSNVIATRTLRVGDKVFLPVTNTNQIAYEVKEVANASCTDLTTDAHLLEVSTPEELPSNLPGLYNQPGIAEYLSSLANSQSIVYGEFGCGSNANTEGCSSADWQDVILRVDTDPYLPAD